MHSPTELEGYSDVLDRSSFTTRESLKDLTESCADALGIPRKLAMAVQAEAKGRQLQRRYSGKIKAVAEIKPEFKLRSAEEELVLAARTPKGETDYTPLARYREGTEAPRSDVCKQVVRVGHRLHPPWELERMSQRLEEGGFKTRGSLVHLTDAAAIRLRVPEALSKALREKACEEIPRLSPKQQRLSPREKGSLSSQTPLSQLNPGHGSSVVRLITPYTPPAVMPRHPVVPMTVVQLATPPPSARFVMASAQLVPRTKMSL
jgi:hypothetical protein